MAVDWEGWVNYIMCEYLCAQEMAAAAHKSSGGRITLMTIIIPALLCSDPQCYSSDLLLWKSTVDRYDNRDALFLQ